MNSETLSTIIDIFLIFAICISIVIDIIYLKKKENARLFLEEDYELYKEALEVDYDLHKISLKKDYEFYKTALEVDYEFYKTALEEITEKEFEENINKYYDIVSKKILSRVQELLDKQSKFNNEAAKEFENIYEIINNTTTELKNKIEEKGYLDYEK